jgi:ketosteroid isomerase-like protein
MRVPAIGRFALRAGMAIPQGRIRQEAIRWAVRAAMDSQSREDFKVLSTLSSPDFEVRPEPRLAALLPGVVEDSGLLVGAEASVRFLEAWFEVFGRFQIEPMEAIDLGGGQVLVLNHLHGEGAASGITLEGQEEAELVTVRSGQVARMEQWWSWQEALNAVGWGNS